MRQPRGTTSARVPDTHPRGACEPGPDIAPPATVAILLCTCQGQPFLAEQLDSFEAQTFKHWTAWASDDRSTDATRVILESYRQRWAQGLLTILEGPAEGFAANFLSLTCMETIQADYYAYADQDDIWEPGKLERALRWLSTVPRTVPALYCGRTLLVDAQNTVIGASTPFRKRPSFANALVQSIGGGNTMVFNDAARSLLCQAGRSSSIISHDWWAYLVVTGCGGRIHYDLEPTLRYRQHGNNVVGRNSTWTARFKRVHMLWQGRLRQWSDRNIAALERMEDQLTPESRQVFRHFVAGRKMSLVPRLVCLLRSGIYRQTLFGNLGLVAAAVFGKI